MSEEIGGWTLILQLGWCGWMGRAVAASQASRLARKHEVCHDCHRENLAGASDLDWVY